jgi:hypothetical protein
MYCLPAVAKGPGGGGGGDGGGSTTTPFSVIELAPFGSPNAISNPADGVVTVVGISEGNAAYWRLNVAARQIIANGSLPSPGNSSIAWDVNSSGVIVGGASPASGSGWAPGRWIAGQGGYACQLLPLLDGHLEGEAEAINNAGEMVGSSDVGALSTSRAVYWPANGNTVYDLNDLLWPEDAARWVLKEACDINNSRQVVGSGLLDDVTRGFVLDLATLNIVPVPLAAGATWNNATQINDANHIIGRGGSYSLPRGHTGSWSYFWGGPDTLPQLLPSTKDGAAFAYGINNLDELAGVSTIAGLSDHDGKDYMFMSLWEPDATGAFIVTDMGTQIPSKPAWYLRSGEGINDDLWIVGFARKAVKGQYSWHGVLLVPNP